MKAENKKQQITAVDLTSSLVSYTSTYNSKETHSAAGSDSELSCGMKTIQLKLLEAW